MSSMATPMWRVRPWMACTDGCETLVGEVVVGCRGLPRELFAIKSMLIASWRCRRCLWGLELGVGLSTPG